MVVEKKISIEELINENKFICITTNGTVKKNGECVMGRGNALTAKEIYPDLPKIIGDGIERLGNRVFWFEKYRLFTFPVKHNYYEKADMNLIKRSIDQLTGLMAYYEIEEKVYLPRPGCYNGKLNWNDVKKELDQLPLPNNLIFIHI